MWTPFLGYAQNQGLACGLYNTAKLKRKIKSNTAKFKDVRGWQFFKQKLMKLCV